MDSVSAPHLHLHSDSVGPCEFSEANASCKKSHASDNESQEHMYSTSSTATDLPLKRSKPTYLKNSISLYSLESPEDSKDNGTKPKDLQSKRKVLRKKKFPRSLRQSGSARMVMSSTLPEDVKINMGYEKLQHSRKTTENIKGWVKSLKFSRTTKDQPKLPQAMEEIQRDKCLQHIYKDMYDVPKLDKLFKKIPRKKDVSDNSKRLNMCEFSSASGDDTTSVQSDDEYESDSSSVEEAWQREAQICYDCLIESAPDMSSSLVIDDCWEASSYFNDQSDVPSAMGTTLPSTSSPTEVKIGTKKNPLRHEHLCSLSQNANKNFVHNCANKRQVQPVSEDGVWSEGIPSDKPLCSSDVLSQDTVDGPDVSHVDSVPICYACLVGNSESTENEAEHVVVDLCWNALDMKGKENEAGLRKSVNFKFLRNINKYYGRLRLMLNK